MDQWLNDCVAFQRVYTTTKGARFDKKKSKQTARIIIIILPIFITSSLIHDLIHRKLIDQINDDDESYQNRLSCIVIYSSKIQFYNSFIHIFHFILSFLINLFSAIILIIKNN